ncbi:hypothetical protein A3862_27290 [Methylobacterium sp. XJLW]|jgi:hypothetical protein|uniref:hypothetical protein n=1 Tax=Methylobacterium sp. XJLW TaxID=739141 RepID=UPI000DAAE125|nr:hypothetical protein [Methylobacterium sp. XJLW]AWV18786.1 hypothetical protein A3862_27290 [Methylobacterium sp. XJLW]
MSTPETLPREEYLRSSRGLRGTPALPLSAWRGASGRRYLVGVHQAQGFEAAEAAEAVCLAVKRNNAGIAELVSVAMNLGPTGTEVWLRRAKKSGATEIHVHRLCESASERTAVAEDLQPE